jgi:O-antigen/teichoic acid export membrane protein
VLLGPKWKEAAGIFRLLAPTILIFAIANPLGWLLNSIGMVGRALKISLVMAPLMIGSYIIGLPYGPRGVAFAYSAIMILCVIPLIACAVRGTVISVYDVLRAVGRPLISGLVAATLALALQLSYGQFLSPLPRLLLGVALVLAGYLGMLLYIMGQKLFYLDLLRAFRRRSSLEEEILVSA